MRIFPFLLALAAAGTLTGCATIVQGTDQRINVNSSPEGATVSVRGEQMGVTPTTLNLKRGRDYALLIELDGYDPITVNLDKEFDFAPAALGNLFSWGILGLVVDISNGAAYELSPDFVDANLAELQAMVETSPEGDEITVVFLTPEQVAAMGAAE